MSRVKEIGTKIHCYHCGEICPDEQFHAEEKYFCCFGCKTVYEILNENDLCNYYDISAHPGNSQLNRIVYHKYDVLDKPETKNKFISYSDGQQTHVTFYLPAMHCSSCIWLLEHLYKVNAAILHARVDFQKKQISVVYDEQAISLSKVAEILDRVGYEPLLSAQDIEKKKEIVSDKSAIIKIGIAGFAFGNTMMMALPEYFAGAKMQEDMLEIVFRYLSLVLALPVFFYCANEFYISSWKSLKNKFLNIDFPIALAIIFTFLRSLYAVFIEGEAGYFDSMTGIVFFMLVGRFFQNKTYKTISFDRNYKSYFPLSVTVIKDDQEDQVPLSELKNGDMILVRNHELIPADALLIFGKGNIDYSFVTGEAEPVTKNIGELIYAGGKQMGASIQLKIVKEVSQSYLTQLWNNSDTDKSEIDRNSFVHLLGKNFAFIVLALSILASAYWLLQGDPKRAMDAFITPMIVACPCALLLSATFTNGNAMRYLGNFGMYLKNAFVLEKLNSINTIVFDKTGTLTNSENTQVLYEGEHLSHDEEQWIASLAKHSTHPYSKTIREYINVNNYLVPDSFEEIAGMGISGLINGNHIKIGSANFLGLYEDSKGKHGISYVSINGKIKGNFNFRNQYRTGLKKMITNLKNSFSVYVLSGDNDNDRTFLYNYADADKMHFNQSPVDKLKFIKNLKKHHKKVMMLGDGLNDAGALQQSDTGVAVSQKNSFTPASDIIIDAEQLIHLDKLFLFAKKSKLILVGSFVLSILYNICGLYFALQGLLSPVIAAILMPLSTITIVVFTTGLTSYFAKRIFKF